MSTCTSNYVVVKDLELHYMQFTPVKQQSEDEKKLLVCWHGLTRTCRDFDDVARFMCENHGYTVIAPDTIGRGYSQWATDPDAQYTLPFYAQMAAELIDHTDFKTCDWIGTSMGGLIAYTGIVMGILKEKINRLLLNDIGPKLNEGGLEIIFEYVQKYPEYERFTDFEEYYKKLVPDLCGNDPAFVRRTFETYARRQPDGKFKAHYDPRIIEIMRKALMPTEEEKKAQEATPKPDPWTLWKMVPHKVLVIRGGTSSLLLPEHVAQMQSDKQGEPCQMHVVEGVGHAPTLGTAEEQAVIAKFFTA